MRQICRDLTTVSSSFIVSFKLQCKNRQMAEERVGWQDLLRKCCAHALVERQMMKTKMDSDCDVESGRKRCSVDMRAINLETEEMLKEDCTKINEEQEKVPGEAGDGEAGGGEVAAGGGALSLLSIICSIQPCESTSVCEGSVCEGSSLPQL